MTKLNKGGFWRVRAFWVLLLSLTALVIQSPLPSAAAPPAQAPSSGDSLWRDVAETSLRGQGDRLIIPNKYRLVAADIVALDNLLAQAPLENTPAAKVADVVLPLPLPDGTLGRFRIEESPIMEPALVARFPEIKTYRAFGLDDLSATARLDRTPMGFHGIIFSSSGTVYIDPYRRDDITHYISYNKRDYGNYWGKSLEEGLLGPGPARQEIAAASSGPILHTYRLAMAATGEYTQFHGGTVPNALAAITTTMNRINGIYEREVSVRLTLVANTDLLIYTNGGTDPYSNNSGGAMLGQNQTNVDTLIGSVNYDIGHVFSTGGGGVAYIQSVCDNSFKAGGVTGSGAPVGDAFDVDYVAHEMGHQFGGNHTFNSIAGSCGGGNRNSSTAYEPGSGSTIMAYAGICGSQDLQPHSDDYFQAISFDEITNFVTNGATGGSCGTHSPTGNNEPTVNAGANYTIPKQTPFTLNGSATDPDSNPLTYQWEALDLGSSPSGGLPNTDVDAVRPIFRSYNPVAVTTRTFPMLSSILDGTNQNIGESLPTRSRNMQFRLTARDNLGGVNSGEMTVTVAGSAGPFAVTAPNTAVTWTGFSQETVTWDVANSTAAPVSCANVDVLLSTDGGNTFPTALAASTPNDGSATMTVPNNGTTTARVKVACANNIFFDISNADFTINAVAVPNLAITKTVTPANSPIQPGDPLTYTIVVSNSGTVSATDVHITDTLPDGVLGDNLDTTATVTNSQSITFTINAALAANPPFSTITNTAYYSHTTGTGQANAVFTTTGSVAPNLSITKTVALANSPIRPGDPVTYTIVVANSGMISATNVRITDTLPSGVLGDNLDTTATVTNGQSVTFTINAALAANLSFSATITNTAYYSHTTGAGQANAVLTTLGSKASVFLPVIFKRD